MSSTSIAWFMDLSVFFLTSIIHAWHVDLHLPLKKSTIHVGKYPSPMDGLHVIHRKTLSNQADYLNDIWKIQVDYL